MRRACSLVGSAARSWAMSSGLAAPGPRGGGDAAGGSADPPAGAAPAAAPRTAGALCSHWDTRTALARRCCSAASSPRSAASVLRTRSLKLPGAPFAGGGEATMRLGGAPARCTRGLGFKTTSTEQLRRSTVSTTVDAPCIWTTCYYQETGASCARQCARGPVPAAAARSAPCGAAGARPPPLRRGPPRDRRPPSGRRSRCARRCRCRRGTCGCPCSSRGTTG